MQTEFVFKSIFRSSFGEEEDLIRLKLIKLLKMSIRGFFLKIDNVRVKRSYINSRRHFFKCNCRLAAEILSLAHLHRSLRMGIWGHFGFVWFPPPREEFIWPGMVFCHDYSWMTFSRNVDNGPRSRWWNFHDFQDLGGTLIFWSFELPKIKRSKKKMAKIT